LDAKQIVEAGLFLSTEPVPLGRLAELAGVERERVQEIVERLREEYSARGSAIQILRVDEERYVMQVKPEVAALAGELAKPEVSRELLKTLAIIALRQPVTQAEVVKMRGSSAYAHVKELVSLGFVESVRAGRTRMLTTTKKFADYFGLSRNLEEQKKQIARMLTGSR